MEMISLFRIANMFISSNICLDSKFVQIMSSLSLVMEAMGKNANDKLLRYDGYKVWIATLRFVLSFMAFMIYFYNLAQEVQNFVHKCGMFTAPGHHLQPHLPNDARGAPLCTLT